jgi:hypothetical protein
MPSQGGSSPQGRSQYPGGRTGTNLPSAVPGIGKTPGTSKDKPAPEPLPTFVGMLKGVDSKTITLESHDENTLVFHCSKKTTFYEGSRKIKYTDLKTGDSLAVEGRKAPDGSLDAVNVRLTEPRS